MATIEATLQTLLGALVSGRCYPVINTALTVTSPYITYQVIAETPLTVSSGGTHTVKSRVQVDVFGSTYGSAKTTAESVKTAMTGATFANVFIAQQDLYEEISKEYRELLEFYIWP